MPAVVAADDSTASFLLNALAQANPIAVGLSTHRNFSQPFKTSTSSPLDFTKLFDHTKLDLPYSELLEVCKDLMSKMKASPSEVSSIEERTRQQSGSILWRLYRLGRVTGSMASKVWRGNINAPAKSTWEVICKGKTGSEESERRKSANPDIQRGLVSEDIARKEYEASQKQTHTNFLVQKSGLVLHSELPYIASSPDGIIFCECCGKGCLEIKCPREENLTACLDGNGHLQRQHDYFFQTQMHMLVTKTNFCDLYLWLNTQDSSAPLKNPALKPVLVRVESDRDFQEELVSKLKDYFLFVILPEMVAKWFTRLSSDQQPPQFDINSTALPNICYCQSPRRDPIVICSGLRCTFKEFHCRCVDLTSAAPRKKWYCQECSPSAPKRSTKRVSTESQPSSIKVQKTGRRRALTESNN